MENTQLELQALYHKAMECYQQTDEEKHEEGLQFLKDAAEKGMADACKLLGIIYMSGQYDPWPAKDMEAAAMWYQKAAEAGDEEAMYWLGQCYELGIGVEADEEQAAYWTQQAEKHGFIAEEEEPAADLPAEPESIQETALKEENQSAQKKAPAEETAKQSLSEEERWLQEEEKARRAGRKYRYMMSFGGAVLGLVIAWVVILLVYLPAKHWLRADQEIFFFAGAALGALLAMIAGAALGAKKAGRKMEEVAEYRKTPFYHAFGCELGHMTPQQTWCRKVYTSLSKNYYPVTYRQREDTAVLREYRGMLYPHWIYEGTKQTAQPEFVLLTEKAIYVVHTAYYTGRIQGDIHEAEWSLFSDGVKDLTAEKIPNMVFANAANIAAVKSELAGYVDWPLEQIPFYNVILLNPEVDIKELRRVSANDNLFFVQGGADKLRGSLGLWESRLSTHNMSMQELREAFAKIGKQFLKRSGW